MLYCDALYWQFYIFSSYSLCNIVLSVILIKLNENELMHIGEWDRLWNRPFSHISDLCDRDHDLSLTLDRVIRHTFMYHSLTSIYVPSFVQIGKTVDGRTLIGRLQSEDRPNIVDHNLTDRRYNIVVCCRTKSYHCAAGPRYRPSHGVGAVSKKPSLLLLLLLFARPSSRWRWGWWY